MNWSDAINSNALISVVVPVYNVELYLDKCVESLLRQTYHHFEILLIDDGSTDSSSVLCDAWSGKDARIRVFHKANGGLSDARNYGLDRIRGEYVTFIDSDDYVEVNYLETLYNLITVNNADIAAVRLKYVGENDIPIKNLNSYPSELVSGSEAMRRMFVGKQFHCSHTKLYKRSLWSNIRFPVGKLYEDYLTTYYLFFGVEKVALSEAPIYYYLQREGSIMRFSVSERKLSILDVSDEVTGFIEANCPDILMEAKSMQMTCYLKSLQQILNTGKDAFPEYQARIVKKAKKEAFGMLASSKVPQKVKIKLLLFLMGKKVFLKVYNHFDGVVKI